MSNQVLNTCARALGKRPTVPRGRIAALSSPVRLTSTTPTNPPEVSSQASSSTAPRLSFGIGSGFFNSSRSSFQLSRTWPTTPESAELRVLLLRRDSTVNAIYDAYLRLMNNPFHLPLPRTMHQPTARPICHSTRNSPSRSHIPDASRRIRTDTSRLPFRVGADGSYGSPAGAYNVYLEIVKSDHKVTERTIALALLALVRRHKMWIFDDHVAAVTGEAYGIAERLVGDLLALQKDLTEPISPMCLDLACRSFKITGSLEKFMEMLKRGYGIDISQPDHLPVEFVERVQAIQKAIANKGGGAPLFPVPDIPKFSTHTLNTTLDMLGRSGKVREMVSAFEVLTTPLPANARRDRYQYDTWEDDEPEKASSNPASTSPRNWLANYVPSASPNTASLSFMIKHTVNFAKFDLCKHYLLLAIYLDRVSDYNLRQQLRSVLRARQEDTAAAELELNSKPKLPPSPNDTIPYVDPPIDIPRVAVSYEMFTKVWGLANQKAHMRTLRGLVRTVRRVIRRKRNDIYVYNMVLKAVPSLAAPIPALPEMDSEVEELAESEIPTWIHNMLKEREQSSRPRRFSLAAHTEMLEKETEKLESFLSHSVRGRDHTSARIQAEMERKQKRREEAIRAAEQLVIDAQKEKERQKAKKESPDDAELSSPLAPAV
ncbi:Fungal specific transcription factor domain [Rhizoctonia solani]|uniref:Fungal specific transcription factor domain n=1 Tax=Rhizoctonia solani TaxID=456999 RepID=A0A8H8NUY9_9AGAM|nr:Fungal specific transcription factor domain [Rhizoctonia solani]QRW18891.1 Fungal specific transcription factor domain [Rhizoctonia solani]